MQKLARKVDSTLPSSLSVRTNTEIRATALHTPVQALVARKLSHSTLTAEKSYWALQTAQVPMRPWEVSSALSAISFLLALVALQLQRNDINSPQSRKKS